MAKVLGWALALFAITVAILAAPAFVARRAEPARAETPARVERSGFDPPMITNTGYPQPLLRPTCTVNIVQDDLKTWPIDLDQVTAYEYAKGPAVTVVHGRWYALNGLAASWSKGGKGERIKVGPEFFRIDEMTTLPLPGRKKERELASMRFLSDLNDLVNKRCPT